MMTEVIVYSNTKLWKDLPIPGDYLVIEGEVLQLKEIEIEENGSLTLGLETLK